MFLVAKRLLPSFLADATPPAPAGAGAANAAGTNALVGAAASAGSGDIMGSLVSSIPAALTGVMGLISSMKTSKENEKAVDTQIQTLSSGQHQQDLQNLQNQVQKQQISNMQRQQQLAEIVKVGALLAAGGLGIWAIFRFLSPKTTRQQVTKTVETEKLSPLLTKIRKKPEDIGSMRTGALVKR